MKVKPAPAPPLLPTEIVEPVGRPGLTYARSGNVLLPLRFARQMPEWRRVRQLRQSFPRRAATKRLD